MLPPGPLSAHLGLPAGCPIQWVLGAVGSQQLPVVLIQWEARADGRVGGGRRVYLSPAPSLVPAGPATLEPLCVWPPALPPLSLACRPLRLLAPPHLWECSQLLGCLSPCASHLISPQLRVVPSPRFLLKPLMSVSCQDSDTSTRFILPATGPGSFMTPILQMRKLRPREGL